MNQNILAYYKAIAEELGTIDGEIQAYSLEWFYNELEPEKLNTLSKAYLQDENTFNELIKSAKSLQEKEVSVEDIEPYLDKERMPYEAQKQAIVTAINKPVSIIQGPPGTGKTKTIINLISSIHGLYPESKIAIVSCNSKAVENIDEQIVDYRGDNEMLSVLSKKYAPLGNATKRRQYWKKILKSKDFQKEKGLTEEAIKNLYDKKESAFHPELMEHTPIFSSTIHSLRKCFLEENGFNNQFDYVIVDECSQVGSMIGFVAMSSAKHLVLFGDKQQLPPVFIEERYRKINEEFQDVIPEEFIEKDDISFMDLCESRFQKLDSSVLLNHHYRCHPGIIGFCNEYVYENQLQVKTEDDGTLPIRIRYYDGDYYESVNKFLEEEEDEEKKFKREIYNKKQIRVFLQEELPLLLERYEENPNLTCCVLAPYNAQLKLLKEELATYAKENEIEDLEVTLEEADALVNKMPQLTIHKAQGQEFDIVYYLPVEDCIFNKTETWSQRRKLINVAVSRAKGEFCVITSTSVMSETLQNQYSKYLCNIKKKKHVPDTNLYLQKLISYVEKNKTRCKEGYGFIRAEEESIFDEVPYFRIKNNLLKRRFAPERCLQKLLSTDEYLKRNYEMHQEVALKDIEGFLDLEEDEIQYIQNGAAFDFVLCQDKKIKIILEVDGQYHRDEKDPTYVADKKKNAIMEKVDVPFLRILTDGTTHDEIELIKEALKEPQDLLELRMEKIMPKKIVQEFRNQIFDITEELKSQLEEIKDNESEYKQVLKLLANRGFEQGDYQDKRKVNDYLMRYGMRYMFEFSYIYRTVFRQLKNKEHFGVVVVGCGSCIDYPALQYAQKICGLDEMKITYKGIDLQDWAVKFVPDELVDSKHIKSGTDILDYLDTIIGWDSCPYQAMLFAKIISELNDEIIDGIVERIKSIKEFSRKEFFVCISHRSKVSETDGNKTLKIVNAFKENLESKGYEMEVMLPEDLSDLTFAETFDGKEYNKRIIFKKSVDMDKIDPVFDLPQEIKNFTKQLYMESEQLHMEGEKMHLNPMYKTNNISFQVIKFTKKES